MAKRADLDHEKARKMRFRKIYEFLLIRSQQVSAQPFFDGGEPFCVLQIQ
jgi:hypothetical protein